MAGSVGVIMFYYLQLVLALTKENAICPALEALWRFVGMGIG